VIVGLGVEGYVLALSWLSARTAPARTESDEV
jgi:3-dehydroquinate dehydratase